MGEEHRKKTNSLLNKEDEENKKKRGHVQEEVARWNEEMQANQQATEEVRRKKDQLLAKMLEIDRQNLVVQDSMCSESDPSESIQGTNVLSPRPPEHRNHNSLIFNLTETEESESLRTGAGSREGGRRRPGIESGAVTSGIGRRTFRTQISSNDLAFGSYAPSFGISASRGSSGFPPAPPKEDKDSALEAIGVFSLKGLAIEKAKEQEKEMGREKKSSLMQQLFGALAIPAGDSMNTSSKMEALNSPPTTNGVHSRREGQFSFSPGSSTPPASSLSTLHVANSRPAIRAISSFDDDVEELTL